MNTPVLAGLKAQKVSATLNDYGHAAGIIQTIQVKPNHQFTISARILAISLNNSKVQIYTVFYNSLNQVVGDHIIDHTSLSSDTLLVENGVVPVDATYAKVYVLLRATSGMASGTFYADSIRYIIHNS